MFYSDCSVYEGEWKHDKRDGRGMLTWPSSSATAVASRPTFGVGSSGGGGGGSRADSLPHPAVDHHESAGVGCNNSIGGGGTHCRYEGTWKDDHVQDGGRVIWEDGSETTLEEALKRSRWTQKRNETKRNGVERNETKPQDDNLPPSLRFFVNSGQQYSLLNTLIIIIIKIKIKRH